MAVYDCGDRFCGSCARQFGPADRSEAIAANERRKVAYREMERRLACQAIQPVSSNTANSDEVLDVAEQAYDNAYDAELMEGKIFFTSNHRVAIRSAVQAALAAIKSREPA